MAINVEQTLLDIATNMAALKKGQDDMHARLFVDGGGILPGLYKKVSDVEVEVGKKADTVTVTGIQTQVTALDKKGIWQQGYAAGAGCVLAFGIKWAAAKIGLHI